MFLLLFFIQFGFPFKMHAMLEDAVQEGNRDIVSWQCLGRTFRIHKPKEFSEKVMPRYFSKTKCKSFQRQLHIYGFKRITDTRSSDFGAYQHPFFIRGKTELCLQMTRQKIKGSSTGGPGSWGIIQQKARRACHEPKEVFCSSNNIKDMIRSGMTRQTNVASPIYLPAAAPGVNLPRSPNREEKGFPGSDFSPNILCPPPNLGLVPHNTAMNLLAPPNPPNALCNSTDQSSESMVSHVKLQDFPNTEPLCSSNLEKIMTTTPNLGVAPPPSPVQLFPVPLSTTRDLEWIHHVAQSLSLPTIQQSPPTRAQIVVAKPAINDVESLGADRLETNILSDHGEEDFFEGKRFFTLHQDTDSRDNVFAVYGISISGELY